MTPCFALKNMIGYDIDQKTPCYALKNMIGCDIDQKISGAMHQILSDQAVSMSTFLASNQNAGNKINGQSHGPAGYAVHTCVDPSTDSSWAKAAVEGDMPNAYCLHATRV